MLFDECLVEYHSSPVSYGRLGGDVETVALAARSHPQMLYSLLVDQSAAVASGYDQSAIATNRMLVTLTVASASICREHPLVSQIAPSSIPNPR